MSSQSPSARQEQPRYFCYSCNAEVPIYMAPDPTCQRCNEQFVQEIDAESDPQSFLNGGHDDAVNEEDQRPHAYFRYDSRTGNEDDVLQFLDSFAPRDEDDGQGGNNRPSIPAMSAMLQNMVTMMLQQTTEGGGGPMAASGGGGTTTTGNEAGTENNEQGGEQQQQRRPQPVLFYGGMVDGNFQLRPMPMPTAQPRGEGEEDGNTTGTGEGGGQGTGGGDNRMNGIGSLLQLLYGLGEGMVGNPNDYVFSQDGFDNIITQLMEQAGGRNAPPPASETVIDSLPKRKVTDEEVAQQVDCAVCKEEFVPTEEAIELPCQHMFHEDCIKPWLKVNGTCPVCRHSVSPEKKDQPENSQASDGGDNARSGTPNASASSDQQGNNNNNRSTFQQTMMENMRRMYFPTAAGWTARPASSDSPHNSNQASSSNNNENNNSNTQQQPQQQPSSDSNNNDNMDLDLD